MRKTLLSLFAMAAVTLTANAQTNLLENGGFESWTDGAPDQWKSTTSASNATLVQSTDAHSGSYAVQVNGASSNKRIAYKELTLKAGTYTFTFYAKAATDGDSVSLRPGYAIVANGSIASNDYKYGNYANGLTYGEWTLVSHEFKLENDTTVNLLIMNSKKPGKNALIDDATLTTTDGGIVEEGGETPDPEPVQQIGYKAVDQVVSGGKYLMVAQLEDGNCAVATPLAATKTYGYLDKMNPTLAGDTLLQANEANAFTFVQEADGYTILGSDGRYLYQKGTYNSFNVADTPTEGQYWSVEANADGTFRITNLSVNKYIQYSVQYNSYGSYADEKGIQPALYAKVDGTDTGISQVTATDVRSGIYSIDGRKLGRLQKGLNIVNGRKVFVR
ncbi:MAG: hypothetical protein PUD40_00705 [Bacteroidales bacterium]|nr:hypothetical protein [Bacteroidales bacterium]